MGRKKAHAPEEIVAKLRQAEVPVGQGKTVADARESFDVAAPSPAMIGAVLMPATAGEDAPPVAP